MAISGLAAERLEAYHELVVFRDLKNTFDLESLITRDMQYIYRHLQDSRNDLERLPKVIDDYVVRQSIHTSLE